MAALALHTYVRADGERELCHTGADKDTPTLQGSDGSRRVNISYDFMRFDWDY